MRKELKSLILLAWPIIVGNLSHILLGVIDNLMIGRLGTVPLAAASFSNAVFTFFIIASIGWTAMVSPQVARAKGEGEPESCGLILFNSLFLNLIVSLAFVVSILFCVWKIEIFNQPEEVVPLAKSYLLILAPTLIFIMIFNSFRQFSEGLSKVKVLLVFAYGSLLLNAFLNWLLIFGHWGFPRMELEGAALATFITRLVAAGLLAAYIFRHPFYKVYLACKWKLQKSFIRQHLNLGFPSSVQYASEAGAFSGSAVLMGWVGTVALASHQIAINLISMTFMIALGTSTAASVRVGEFIGHGRKDLARRSGFVAISLGGLAMGLSGLTFFFTRDLWPQLYVQDQAVILLAAELLVVGAAFQFSDGVQGVAVGALRGLMDAKWPTYVTIVAFWGISLPAGYVFAFKMGYGAIGIWYGKFLALSFAALFHTIRFHFLTKEKP